MKKKPHRNRREGQQRAACSDAVSAHGGLQILVSARTKPAGARVLLFPSMPGPDRDRGPGKGRYQLVATLEVRIVGIIGIMSATPIKNPSVGNTLKNPEERSKIEDQLPQAHWLPQGSKPVPTEGRFKTVTASIRLSSRIRRSNGRPCNSNNLAGCQGAARRRLPHPLCRSDTGYQYFPNAHNAFAVRFA